MKCILWLLRLILTLLLFFPPPPPLPLSLLPLCSHPPLISLCFFFSSILPPSSSPLTSLGFHPFFSLPLPQMTLKDNGRVRLFKLGVASDEYAVVFTNEYIDHAKKHLGSTTLCKKFVDVVLPACQDVSITRNQLTDELRLSEEDIS